MDCIDKKENETCFDSIKQHIEKYIRQNLKEKRLTHTYSVAEEAKKLAARYGEDTKRAELAALFHDMFRSSNAAALDMYVRQFDLPKTIMGNPNLSHGKIAAEIMRRDYRINDEEMINAVSYHTTGRAGMSMLEKIIFLADAIEPGRSYPAVDEIRSLAYADIDKACISSLERTVEYIRGKGEYLDPDTENALKDLKEKLEL